MNFSDDVVNELARETIRRLRRSVQIPVEASGRHVHLKKEDVEKLFGAGHKLKSKRPLSQPGQYLCEERVTLKTDRGELCNVAVLGPERAETQIELSLTDAAALSLKAPVRESGDVAGSAPITIISGTGSVSAASGVIIAMRHLHVTPNDAEYLGLKSGDLISMRVQGARPAVYENILVRVSPAALTVLHIDYDEANACGYTKGVCGLIV